MTAARDTVLEVLALAEDNRRDSPRLRRLFELLDPADLAAVSLDPELRPALRLELRRRRPTRVFLGTEGGELAHLCDLPRREGDRLALSASLADWLVERVTVKR